MRRISVHSLLKIILPLLLIFGSKQCYADTVSIPLRYYHSDHLGSASWITNGSGNPVQHLQYMPYGEPFVNERSSSYNERFTFTGKERDSETGYSYFGARFYDSDLMTGWLSIDPQSDKFPNISPYAYCNWNPVKLKDQDGEAPIKAFVTAAKLVKKAYNIYKKTGNLTMKSLKKAGLDELIGIADDINTIFSGDASLTDRITAGVDLLVGTELNNKGAKKSLSITGVKKGPPPNGGKSKPHGGYRHNEEIDNVIKSIPKNAKSIRKNQVQVDVNGNKVGNNRPDIQYDYEGKHYVIEIDNRKRSSTMHEKTIRQNDPKCEIKLTILE